MTEAKSILVRSVLILSTVATCCMLTSRRFHSVEGFKAGMNICSNHFWLNKGNG